MDLEKHILECKLCGNLPKLTKNFIQIGRTNFIIIGESPAKDGWIESGKAFYNTSGKLQASGRIMQKLLDIVGCNIEDIYFTECCKCIIEDRKILAKCCKNCLPILYDQLLNLPCKYILTMGLHTTEALLRHKIKKFGEFAGKEFEININDKIFTLIPIYHPSPLNPKGYSGNIDIFENLKNII